MVLAIKQKTSSVRYTLPCKNNNFLRNKGTKQEKTTQKLRKMLILEVKACNNALFKDIFDNILPLNSAQGYTNI